MTTRTRIAVARITFVACAAWTPWAVALYLAGWLHSAWLYGPVFVAVMATLLEPEEAE